MLNWIVQYWVTLLVGLVLIGVVAAIVAVLVRDRKKGKCSCGCNCQSCAMAGACHKKQ